MKRALCLRSSFFTNRGQHSPSFLTCTAGYRTLSIPLKGIPASQLSRHVITCNRFNQSPFRYSSNESSAAATEEKPDDVIGLSSVDQCEGKLISEGELVDEELPNVEEKPHSIITDQEKSSGSSETKSFVAETQRLLQIVAQSLYSDNEVFLRELVSNSCDALEKMRIYSLTQRSDRQFQPLEIHLKTDDVRGQLIIQDTGIGMSKAELIENLGTIAQSGSKAFVEQMEAKQLNVSKDSIIGQFGVGFYSAFMVSNKVEVFSQSNSDSENSGVYWCSEGGDSYTVQEATNVQPGTKIVLTLKDDCLKFAQESVVKEVIKKFATFFDKPIYVNGMKLDSVEPAWTKEKLSEDELKCFYQSIVPSGTEPRFTLQYKTDVPVNMRCILFVPGESFNMFSALTPKDSGADVSLYSRKVLIQKRVDSKILPDWTRFLKGVVDSEDIPLNLSREILQNSDLLFKIKRVLSTKIINFLSDQYKRRREAYSFFYKDYGDFIREGVLSLAGDKADQEELMKLLVFQSNKLPSEEYCNLDSYIERMKPGQRDIFYLSAPSRELAEASPYMQTLAASGEDYEVLFALKPFDDITLSQSYEYKKNKLKSVENFKPPENKSKDEGKSEGDVDVIKQFEDCLGGLVHEVSVSPVDFKSPALIRNFDMSMSRHMLLTAMAGKSEEEKLKFLHVQLELNPQHPIVKKVVDLKESDPEMSKLLARQVLDNALVAAGLTTDARLLMTRLDTLLSKLAPKL